MKKCTIIAVGDELLIGQVVNTNAAWISEYLLEFGIHCVEHISIADTREAIHNTLDKIWDEVDLMIITGGLGPTKDDITKKALADYFDDELYYDEDLFERISSAFRARNIEIKESHKAQCFMPKSIKVLRNNLGTAPGMLFEKENKYVISLPGVPFEMKKILQEDGRVFLSSLNADFPYFQKTIMTSGQGETSIADKIEDILNDMPDFFKIAYLPSYGSVRLRLSSTDQAVGNVHEIGESIIRQIVDRIGSIVYGYDDIPLASVLGQQLKSKNFKLALAESCTGGAISQKITAIPGSSAYYMGAIVAYSNEIKKNILGVSEDTLSQHGAVSEATVIEMLTGALRVLDADVGISISGIAGPGGGSPEKPVGTIWIAYGSSQDIRTKRLLINRNRETNIRYASHFALDTLRKYLVE